MSYRKEFPAEYSVPEKIDQLVQRGVLKDDSWHNDSCPSFRLVHEAHLVLWVAPEMKQHRECPSDLRFSLREELTGCCSEDIVVKFETEDINKMLEYILVTER